MLRQAGVDIWKITWVIAPVEGRADAGHGHVPPGAPPNVQGGPAGKSLVDLLLAGEIDVLVAAFMPTGFFSPDSPIVPMIRTIGPPRRHTTRNTATSRPTI